MIEGDGEELEDGGEFIAFKYADEVKDIISDLASLLINFKPIEDDTYDVMYPKRTLVDKDFLANFIAILRNFKRILNKVEAYIYLKAGSIEYLCDNLMGDLILIQSLCVKYLMGWRMMQTKKEEKIETLYFLDLTKDEVDTDFTVMGFTLDGMEELINEIKDLIGEKIDIPTIIADVTQHANILKKIGVINILKRKVKKGEYNVEEEDEDDEEYDESDDISDNEIDIDLDEDEEIEIEEKKKKKKKKKKKITKMDIKVIDSNNYRTRILMEGYSIHNEDLPVIIYKQKVIKIDSNHNINLLYEVLFEEEMSYKLIKEMNTFETLTEDLFSVMDALRKGKKMAKVHDLNGHRIMEPIELSAFRIIRMIRNKSDSVRRKVFIHFNNLAVSKPVLFQCCAILNDSCVSFINLYIFDKQGTLDSNKIFMLEKIETALSEFYALVDLIKDGTNDLMTRNEVIVFLGHVNCPFCNSSKKEWKEAFGTDGEGFFVRSDVKRWMNALENRLHIDVIKYEWGDMRGIANEYCYRFYNGSYASMDLTISNLPVACWGIKRVEGYDSSEPMTYIEENLWGKKRKLVKETRAKKETKGLSPDQKVKKLKEIKKEIKKKPEKTSKKIDVGTKNLESGEKYDGELHDDTLPPVTKVINVLMKEQKVSSLTKLSRLSGISGKIITQLIPEISKKLNEDGFRLITSESGNGWKRYEVKMKK